MLKGQTNLICWSGGLKVAFESFYASYEFRPLGVTFSQRCCKSPYMPSGRPGAGKVLDPPSEFKFRAARC